MKKIRGYFAARKFLKLVRRLDKLVPLLFHEHSHGRADCPACMIGHPFAPHFIGCECGHCPEPERARQAVLRALKAQDRAAQAFEER